MLNFRKLKQDFSSNILTEGKELHQQNKVESAKILKLDTDTIRLSAKVVGKYGNTYESEIEIDRFESQTIHSNCDCTYRYDCQHLAALVFCLEEKMDSILVEYSKEADIDKDDSIDSKQKEQLLEKIKEAQSKEVAKKDAKYQRQVVQEYKEAAHLLSSSPFFLSNEENELSKAEVAVLFNPESLEGKKKKHVDFQLALRLPGRSKPLHVTQLKEFFQALRYEEPYLLSGRRFFFSLESFNEIGRIIIKILMDHAFFQENLKNDRAQRLGHLQFETFGTLLAKVHRIASHENNRKFVESADNMPQMPGLFSKNLETPLLCSYGHCFFRFELEYIAPPGAKLLINPKVVIDHSPIDLTVLTLFECQDPGVIYENIYYRLPDHIKRVHLRSLKEIRDLTIPEPLFGTFVENSLPELQNFAEIANHDVIENFVTLPYVGDLKGKCTLSYLDGELEASLQFFYDNLSVNAALTQIGYDDISPFAEESGILARNLVEERKILDALFADFLFQPESGTFIAKTEKKIVEFMTEIIPKFQEQIQFDCPQNLLDQFIYDETKFTLSLDYKDEIGFYEVDLKVDGQLENVLVDVLWDCMAAKRSFVEMHTATNKKKQKATRFSKILVLDLERIGKIIQIFDELGITTVENQISKKPLWSLVNIDEKLFSDIDVKFSMSPKLKKIRKQMLGETKFVPSEIPKDVHADLRPYQQDGVHWLERLRSMFLNGILADDMGLGKTLQAICAISQMKKKRKNPSLVVCPTSLLYNWKEEIAKFDPTMSATIIEGVPSQRKKMIDTIGKYDVIITSYSLIQKDIELYKKENFTYVILDEAQHIKNRTTRNAKSVKQLQSAHRLILTGTPIENSLDELWSLFDFLMPGLLSTYDRFSEKYVRTTGEEHSQNIAYLKRKVSPFILRRMKTDVLKDLPPVSEIVYYTQLAQQQEELYRSYAESARDELSKLVAKEGFEKVQIHVLATLTRLKQICCHPAIFAKDLVEEGDSAKYELLLETLQSLVEGGHKTVIFSQYTRMLQIMREDFEVRGIKFCYLDGSTKNRLDIVKEFNQNGDIPVFLVSLKAGGTGLNITGADTVIHYDMWWNPAVENQATDRVHRIGQTKAVSAFKLVTKGTIEEKIMQMQQRKKGLVKKVVSCDDEAIAKLTWEEVLELLQT